MYLRTRRCWRTVQCTCQTAKLSEHIFQPYSTWQLAHRYPKRNFGVCGCRMVGWQCVSWLRLCWACISQLPWLSLGTSCTALKIVLISAMQLWSRELLLVLKRGRIQAAPCACFAIIFLLYSSVRYSVFVTGTRAPTTQSSSTDGQSLETQTSSTPWNFTASKVGLEKGNTLVHSTCESFDMCSWVTEWLGSWVAERLNSWAAE